MTRDGEIPAIFNPRRVRTPSVVVTGDSPNGPLSTGGCGGSAFTNILQAQLSQSDSVASSQHDGADSVQIAICHTSAGGLRTPTQTSIEAPVPPQPPINTITTQTRKKGKCKDSCCSELAQKMYFGVCVTILVTASWVGATHCLKLLYMQRGHAYKVIATKFQPLTQATPLFPATASTMPNLNQLEGSLTLNPDMATTNTTSFPGPTPATTNTLFYAPFFASWFCTNFAILFFPIYLLGRIAVHKCENPCEILGDVIRGFRDRGFTIGRFLNRCMIFCVLWLLTCYLYALSLRALLVTDVLALFATNVASVYLLSWVILHEQFVGVRIVAVILCDTGIALLAYMDGITGSPTLSGVVYAALAAAGYAVFKVMFRKVMGDPPIGQIAFTFTTIGFLNASLLWPVSLALYFSGTERMPWERLPWTILLIASILLLVFHILTQFSNAVTYNMFVTLGLITAVPVSAALDVVLYGAHFAGMKLAGVILISVGFFLVMFPDNWPDYITRLLRKTGRAIFRYQCCCEIAEIDYDNSKYHLVGSQREMGSRSPQRYPWGSPSHGHRLSDGLHTIPSSLTIRPCEMTDSISLSNHSGRLDSSLLSETMFHGTSELRRQSSYVVSTD